MKYYSLFLYLCLGIHWYAASLVPFLDEGRLVRAHHESFFVYSHVAFYKAATNNILNWDIVGRFDQGVSNRRDLNKRYFLSIGHSGLQGGAFIKWVPVTGYKKYQPAIGANVGLAYRLEKFWQASSYKNLKYHFVELHVQPFISKELNTIIGPIIPYIALPTTLQFQIGNLQTKFNVSGVFGMRGEVFFIYFHKFEFNIELSAGLLASNPNYISLGILTRL